MALKSALSNDPKHESCARDADFCRNNLNNSKATLADIEILARNTFKAYAPEWLYSAMVARDELMFDVLVYIVGQLKK